jgi:ribosomal protein S25
MMINDDNLQNLWTAKKRPELELLKENVQRLDQRTAEAIAAAVRAFKVITSETLMTRMERMEADRHLKALDLLFQEKTK